MKIPEVMFVLPAAGASGGANSVVQEAMELSRLGTRVGIAVDSKNIEKFRINYPELSTKKLDLSSFSSVEELSIAAEKFNIVVATVNTSVAILSEAISLLKQRGSKSLPRVAYYVQDYEPLFYEQGSNAWQNAYNSYTYIPGAVLFAKTKWLQDVVYANHGIRVSKVSPSIDHEIYYPNAHQKTDRLRIVAMLRPKTPRRAPFRTVRIMEMLGDIFGESVTLSVFGSSTDELEKEGFKISGRIYNRERLKRIEVPDLFRNADMFLDLSDYQAFGRTGLESMTCGAIPVVPLLGGTAEYAIHGHNAYVVDTRSDDEIIKAVSSFVEQSYMARIEMRQNALETASSFTVTKAALSELRLFRDMLSE